MTIQSRSFGQLTIHIDTYSIGDALVELFDADNESVIVLSINILENAHELEENEFFAKTYSENEEIAHDALTSGIFLDTGRRIGEMNTPIWQIRIN